MFPSKQEVKYVRAPLIEHARNYLQNEIRTPPQMILLHTGTNDLERANSLEELVSNILIMITKASTKFPSSKILFSTLLPHNDIPTLIITSINDQVIKSCSKLPNVQLIKHDNLFASQLDILRDNKHILKRHKGLFAKNLKDAIHGRVRQRQHQFTSPHYPNTPLRHTSYSSAVKNTPSHSYRGPKTHPPPIPLVTPRLQQIAPTPFQAAPYQNPNAPSQTLPHPTNVIHQQIPPATHQTAPHQHHNALHQTLPHAAKQEPVREVTRPSSSLTNTAISEEIISFLRFLKSFI